MKVKVNELMPHMSGIYKIDFLNGKTYIGLSCDIRRRMWEHNNPSNNQTVCDRAINKYGHIKEIEILEFVSDMSNLSKKEIFWIDYYQSNHRELGYNLTEGGKTSSARSKFSDKEILDIRKRKFNGERKVDVYKIYSNFNFSTFENIWLWRTKKDVGYKDYYEPSLSRKEASKQANTGEKNGRAKLTNEDVFFIRELYSEGFKGREIHQTFYPHISRSSIYGVINKKTFKNI